MEKMIMMLLALVLLIAGCGDENSSSANGENKQTFVATWGGDYQNFLTNFVEPALTTESDVVYVPESTASRLTKIQVEKDGKGTFDVVTMEDNVMQQLINEDLVLELDYDKIPNASNIKESLQSPYYIPHIYSAGTIIYNKNLIKEEPDSWEVLWDPQYKGKVGVYVGIFTRYLYAAAALEGVVNNKWDDAWDKLLQLKENEPKFYTSQEQLATALQTGEVAVTIGWKSRAVQWNDAGGDPIGSVIPKEGTYPTVFGAGILKNSQNVDEAYDYLNAMLEPGAQLDFAESMGYSPTVENAKLSDDLTEKIGFTEEELLRIKSVDQKYIAENYSAWKEKFDKELTN